ncbi:transporter substrate-binding domain-containing protein [Oscillospiraceae bacterium MB08-C2-2]|nr:transporter substrate-binding domain-containing protein [Oscillospiraceae bacterium MB08-C2-2]
MLKKMTSLIIAMLLLVTALTGCGAGGASKAESSAITSASTGTEPEKKVLRIGMECAYAPFNWTQASPEVSNGEQAVPIKGTGDYAYGYDVILAKKLADHLGWELEITKVEWSSIVLGLNAGNYDAILAGMGYTEERDKTVDFTQPYYIRNNVLIVKADGKFANATKLSEFDGASATTQLGTTWEQYVPQIPNVNQQTYYETTAEVVMAVAMGSAEAGVLDAPTAISAAIANPDIKVITLDPADGFTVPAGQSLNVCIAVKEGDKELLDTLNSALKEISWDEGEMTEIMDLAIQLQPLSN